MVFCFCTVGYLLPPIWGSIHHMLHNSIRSSFHHIVGSDMHLHTPLPSLPHSCRKAFCPPQSNTILTNTGWHKKTGTFEKPNKNWRNPTKKNYWQKLNHYYLPCNRLVRFNSLDIRVYISPCVALWDLQGFTITEGKLVIWRPVQILKA